MIIIIIISSSSSSSSSSIRSSISSVIQILWIYDVCKARLWQS